MCHHCNDCSYWQWIGEIILTPFSWKGTNGSIVNEIGHFVRFFSFPGSHSTSSRWYSGNHVYEWFHWFAKGYETLAYLTCMPNSTDGRLHASSLIPDFNTYTCVSIVNNLHDPRSALHDPRSLNIFVYMRFQHSTNSRYIIGRTFLNTRQLLLEHFIASQRRATFQL